MKIAVFMGGVSSEREVSLWTGQAILESLQRQGYDAYGVDVTAENRLSAYTDNVYDLAYLAFHGEEGEGGRVQSVLDMLGKPYTGSGVIPSAVAMDKALTKRIARDCGIRVAKSWERLEDVDSWPVVVKPAREGSSVGVYICADKGEAEKAVALSGGKKLVIEEFIKGEELTVGVLNGEALGVLRIFPKAAETYDYQSKYAVGGSVHEFPAKIKKQAYDEAMAASELIHRELGLSGISRSDFLLKGDELYFLEVNTCPGMTKTSLVPDLGTLKGYSYDDLVRITVETFGPR
ncbi:MAG: D-alanine--D-alanine ligase [Fusobacteriaceae bacterium]|jgi:D-alanine-D-alanine ligase|nr:D-alanine--D-alanine ligase [Fusobacteriaceae bacterium]